MDDLTHQLGQLGLNAYESRAYIALLGKESFTATEVADLSAVPRQRIYDILSSLVERGLAISKPGRRGTRYEAVAPQHALNLLLEQEQARLTRLQTVTVDLVTTLTQMYQTGKDERSPLEYIKVLRGRAAITRYFAEIQEQCQREILALTKPPYATPPKQNVEGLEALDRNIRARSIYERSVLESASTREAIAVFIQHGEESRFVERLPLKLVIVDEQVVLFAMEDPVAGRSELTIMVVENAQLAQVLKLAFETIWAQGETFEQACGRMGLPADAPVAR